VYGVKESIWAVLRGVMDCLGSRGVARTERALITAEKANNDRLRVLTIIAAFGQDLESSNRTMLNKPVTYISEKTLWSRARLDVEIDLMIL
jgi:hypothetical protein